MLVSWAVRIYIYILGYHISHWCVRWRDFRSKRTRCAGHWGVDLMMLWVHRTKRTYTCFFFFIYFFINVHVYEYNGISKSGLGEKDAQTSSLWKTRKIYRASEKEWGRNNIIYIQKSHIIIIIFLKKGWGCTPSFPFTLFILNFFICRPEQYIIFVKYKVEFLFKFIYIINLWIHIEFGELIHFQ